jgi:hypothetical protein
LLDGFAYSRSPRKSAKVFALRQAIARERAACANQSVFKTDPEKEAVTMDEKNAGILRTTRKKTNDRSLHYGLRENQKEKRAKGKLCGSPATPGEDSVRIRVNQNQLPGEPPKYCIVLSLWPL